VTLVLTRRDVAALLDLDTCIAAVESAFRLHGQGQTLPPAVLGVPAPGGGFHVKAAGLGGYFAAKCNGNFSDNPRRFGLPAIQGVVVLAAAANGAPLAVLDSIEITILRTGAATAVAAKHLARPDARIATICGCGRQGRVQLRSLARVLRLTRAHAFDLERQRAESFALDLSAELGIEVVAVDDLPQAVRHSDVIVTCTPSRAPFLRKQDVRPGSFVAAVGADSADKQELDADLVAESVLVVDILDQCATIGELHHALAAGLLTRQDVRAELADVVVGRGAGRRTPDEIVIFDSTGTALQDVAAAAAVYEKAVAAGLGLVVDLGD
jgi:ornithine cyclodeaminase/alanine dehydrogenase-like protein (mu-crystallin family)